MCVQAERLAGWLAGRVLVRIHAIVIVCKSNILYRLANIFCDCSSTFLTRGEETNNRPHHCYTAALPFHHRHHNHSQSKRMMGAGGKRRIDDYDDGREGGGVQRTEIA